MLDNAHWFCEIEPFKNSAFALPIKRKVHEEQSPFQKLEIYETETFGYLMVIDGCVMLTSRDNFFYHEMMSHPVLYTHPHPQTVWIIGGGDCGTLREVLKHDSVQRAVQIDIDERVTRLAEIYFPELCASNHDPRADLKFIDGIQWVRDAESNSVDIIIIDSTDPVGPAEGLFTEAFYRDCVRCLTPAGLLVQQSESPLYHLHLIQAMQDALTNAGFAATQTLFFPQCVYPSGWWSATLAAKHAFSGFRETDAAQKTFETLYYNAAIHQAALAQPEFFRRAFGAA